jgi:hypothetical protein
MEDMMRHRLPSMAACGLVVLALTGCATSRPLDPEQFASS